MTPSFKASLATFVFALAGIGAILFYAPVGPFLLPHALIYAVLVVNTFFSIRFWSALQPVDNRQFFIDAVLIAAYLALALSIGKPLHFALAALMLFIAAPIKYMLMRGRIPHEALRRRKMLLDYLGTVSCIALTLGTLAGYALGSAWLFALGFTLANIYLLFIRPMYRL